MFDVSARLITFAQQLYIDCLYFMFFVVCDHVVFLHFRM